MKKKSEKALLKARDPNMFDVVKDYAKRYRKKKGNALSSRRKEEKDAVIKDMHGAFKAFVDAIKIDHSQHDYTDFFKLMIDNSHTYIPDEKLINEMGQKKDYDKIDWIKKSSLLGTSIRLVKRLEYVLESYRWNQADDKSHEKLYSVKIPVFIEVDEYKESDNSAEDSSENTKKNKYVVNSNYWYEGADIMLCLNSKLTANNYTTRDGCTYLLNGKYNSFSDKSDDYCIVAVCPESDSMGITPINYYLDHEVGQDALHLELLMKILKDNEFITKLKNSPKEMALLISEKFIGTDSGVVSLIVEIILDSDFEIEKLNAEINRRKANHDITSKRTDVFEELLPALNQEDLQRAKIIFPFNRWNNHWLSLEIEIIAGISSFYVNVITHDPYGEGVLDEKNFNLLRESINKKLTKFRLDEVDIIFKNMKSPFKGRQAKSDNTSCGVVVVEDLFLRILGKSLDREPYSIGSEAQRLEQLKEVCSVSSGTEPHKISHFVKRSGAKLNRNKTSPSQSKIESDEKESGFNIKTYLLREIEQPNFEGIIRELFNADYLVLLDLLKRHSHVRSYRKIMANEIIHRVIQGQIMNSENVLKVGMADKVAEFINKSSEYKDSKEISNKKELLKELQILSESIEVYQFYVKKLILESKKESGVRIGYYGINVASHILEINLYVFRVEGGKFLYKKEGSNIQKLQAREVFIKINDDLSFSNISVQFGVLSVQEVNSQFRKSYYEFRKIGLNAMKETFEAAYEEFNYGGLTLPLIQKDAEAFFQAKYEEMWAGLIGFNSEDPSRESFLLGAEEDAPKLLKLLQDQFDELSSAQEYCVDKENNLANEWFEKSQELEDIKDEYYNTIIDRIIVFNNGIPFKGIPKIVVNRIIDEYAEKSSGIFDVALPEIVRERLKSWSGVLSPAYIDERTQTNLVCYAAQYINIPVSNHFLKCGNAEPYHKDENGLCANDYSEISRVDKEGKLKLSKYTLESRNKFDEKMFFAFNSLRELEKIVFTYIEGWILDDFNLQLRNRQWPLMSKVASYLTSDSSTFRKTKDEAERYLMVISEAKSNFLMEFLVKIHGINKASSGRGVASKLHKPIKEILKLFQSAPKYSYVREPAPLIFKKYHEVVLDRDQIEGLRLAPHYVHTTSTEIVQRKNDEISHLTEENTVLNKRVEELQSSISEYNKDLNAANEESKITKEKMANLSGENIELKKGLNKALKRLGDLEAKVSSQGRMIVKLATETVEGEIQTAKATSPEPANNAETDSNPHVSENTSRYSARFQYSNN